MKFKKIFTSEKERKSVLKKLKSALKDEKSAPYDYMKLRKNLHSSSDKKIITGIIKQEKSHFKKLKKIIQKHNGKI